jgi:hypothetical protein
MSNWYPVEVDNESELPPGTDWGAFLPQQAGRYPAGFFMKNRKQHQRKRLVYRWYVFVLKSGEVKKGDGTELREEHDSLTVYDERLWVLAIPKSEIVDRWAQDAPVTEGGELRIQEALRRISKSS